MTNHRQYVKLIWCEKKWHCFSSLLKGLVKGNESRHYAFRCFLRIAIFKAYSCKFSQRNGDFLK